MDSFRPGATSYCPFENKSEVAEGGAGVGPPAGSPQDLALLRPSELGLARPAEDRETEPLSLSAQEENRRRLYLNVGRPRPFYGVSQSAVQQAEQDPPNTTTSNQHIKTKVRLRPDTGQATLSLLNSKTLSDSVFFLERRNADFAGNSEEPLSIGDWTGETF